MRCGKNHVIQYIFYYIKVFVMKIKTVLFMLLLGLHLPAFADDFGEAVHKADIALKSGDYDKALNILRPAAEQRDAYAQVSLGLMYHTGLGVPQDYLIAYMWFNIAASNGDKVTIALRDAVANKMTPTAIAEGQRLARECVAKKYKNC